jgi:hypothetical protein
LVIRGKERGHSRLQRHADATHFTRQGQA